MRSRYFLLLLCFLLSGATALVYQTAWAQQFAQVFGASELAVATVLATFMGGLALGSFLVGRKIEKIRRPIRFYGFLEAGIGLSALAIPIGIEMAGRLQVALFRSPHFPSAGSTGSSLFHVVCSALILLPPTVLMGATLPLLARTVVRSNSELSARIGQLYAANTLGAAAGALIAAYFLLPSVGLEITVWIAVAVNALIFLAALWLDGRHGTRRSPTARNESGGYETGWSVILPLTLLSGAIFFTLEVLWTRLLTHVLGGSLHAFGAMLATFLIGLAAGGAVGGRFGRDRAQAARVFVVSQLGAAIASLLVFLWVDSLPAHLKSEGLPGLSASVLLAAATLLPAALFLGASFPAAVRVLAGDAQGAARASARVLAWNTVGAILGSLLTGFVLLPAWRFEGVMLFVVAAGCLAAAAGALWLRPRWIAAAVIAFVVLIVAFLRPPQPPLELLKRSALGAQEGEVVHYEVGRTASVLLMERADGWRLASNGLPEALIQKKGARRARQTVPRWLGGLASFVRPETKSVLVVGLGGGTALEDMPSSLASIDVVELEPEVEVAVRSLAKERLEDPLADPRIRIVHDDARSFLRLVDRRYDAVLSQPSHPWTGGSSHLFTREFFSLVHDRLTADGVLVQWIGLAFVDEDLVRLLLATLNEVFEEVEIFLPAPGKSILFVASDRAMDPAGTAALALDGARSQWLEIGVVTPLDLTLARVADAKATREMARGAEVNTDAWNRLQSRSARIVRSQSLHGRPGAVLALDRSTPPGLESVSRLLRFGARARAQAVAEGMSDDADGLTARALVGLASGKTRQAARNLRAALELEPEHRGALAASLVLHASDIRSGRHVRIAERFEDDPERALVEAWKEAGQNDWRAVAALDQSLASAADSHPLAEHCLRLRVQWRVQLGVEGERALELVDRLLAPLALAEDLLLRVEAALLSKNADAAASTLHELGRGIERRRLSSRYLEDTIRLAQILVGEYPDHAQSRRALDRLARLME